MRSEEDNMTKQPGVKLFLKNLVIGNNAIFRYLYFENKCKLDTNIILLKKRDTLVIVFVISSVSGLFYNSFKGSVKCQVLNECFSFSVFEEISLCNILFRICVGWRLRYSLSARSTASRLTCSATHSCCGSCSQVSCRSLTSSQVRLTSCFIAAFSLYSKHVLSVLLNRPSSLIIIIIIVVVYLFVYLFIYLFIYFSKRYIFQLWCKCYLLFALSF